MFKNIYHLAHSCHNFPVGLQQAARGTCICETSLFLTKREGGGILVEKTSLPSFNQMHMETCK